MASKSKKTKSELRTLRIQQAMFIGFSVIIILSMVLAMVAR
jgi:hypothetical protein